MNVLKAKHPGIKKKPTGLELEANHSRKEAKNAQKSYLHIQLKSKLKPMNYIL
jgi:hypothetical protein